MHAGSRHCGRIVRVRDIGIAALLAACAWQACLAGPLAERRAQQRVQSEQGEFLDLEDTAPLAVAPALPADTRIVRDVPYGDDGRQRFDVYAPKDARNAPVIFMVHGGGWFRGDKAMHSVIDNKAARWVPKGFVVISANYRLQPQADPIEQARDVARALAAAQRQAASWGADPAKFILMGYSAGAHLVALLAASPKVAEQLGAMPWLGTVALDSAALDVVKIMEASHVRLYDRAFGCDRDFWRRASPWHALTQPGKPLLAVCSTRRDTSCAQAEAFAVQASALGTRATVLQEDLTHRDINLRLGLISDYTRAVEAFLSTLDPAVAPMLAAQPGVPSSR